MKNPGMKFFYIPLLFLLSSCSDSFSQTVLIRGQVKNDIDSALSWASVLVKGTKIVTATNEKGEFSIAVQKLPVSLVFSAVGYQRKELLVKKKDSSKYISVAISLL